MSILSSTQSGKFYSLTSEQLLRRGYAESNNFFNRVGRDNSCWNEFIQQTKKCGKTIFYVYIFGRYKGYVYLRSTKALDELEQYWDEQDKNTKEMLAKQLVEKYGNKKI